MSEDLERVIKAADKCHETFAPKPFRVLAAFARDNASPAPADATYAFTRLFLDRFTRSFAIAGTQCLPVHIPTLLIAAEYCRHAWKRMEASPVSCSEHSHARLYARWSELTNQWVYRRENDNMPGTIANWAPVLRQHGTLLDDAHDTLNKGISLIKHNNNLAESMLRNGLFHWMHVVARYGRRSAEYAKTTADWTFVEASMTRMQRGHERLKKMGAFPEHYQKPVATLREITSLYEHAEQQANTYIQPT